MSDPAAFQRAFAAALASADAAAIRDPAVARALRIHRNTAAKAAQDAVLDNHPVVRALVGEAALRACAAAFVEAHPPREPRLCLYGDGFDGFVAQWPAFEALPWLADVARLERLVTRALFAADAPALDGAGVAARLAGAGGLALHPATRFAPFAAPAAEIWLAHQDDAPEDAVARIAWRPGAALVTRPEGAVAVTPIGAAALACLGAVAAGLSPAEIARAAAATADGADIAAVFSSLILAGAFA